jgi:hypothetical protein
VDVGTFGGEAAGQGCFGEVVACDALSGVEEKPRQRTHADAADAQKIYVRERHGFE